MTAGGPLEFAQCPVCAQFGQLLVRRDWTLYAHREHSVIHAVPTAPVVGSATRTQCPDCAGGFIPQTTARLRGHRVVSYPVFHPCLRCRTTSYLPGFVMPT